MPRPLLLAAALTTFAFFASERTSDAEERWVDRPMTLHQGILAFDPGVGIGHQKLPGPDANGLGLNLEASYGILERLEVGLRTGLRIGDDARFTRADGYGRVLWTETYLVGADTLANPEARIRWVAYSGSVAEVGLDGRVYLPIEHGTALGIQLGVPLAFHVSDFVRIDTGAYIPIEFTDKTTTGITFPGYFWFQTSEKIWLGPMASLRVVGANEHDAHLLLGFGMGYQITSAVDLKWQFLFPAADNGLDAFGLGFGAQIRLGE